MNFDLREHLKPFTKADFRSYNGATRFGKSDPPLVAYVKASKWPEDISVLGNQVAVVVDKHGIYVIGTHGYYSYTDKFSSSEEGREMAAEIISTPIDYREFELSPEVWTPVDFVDRHKPELELDEDSEEK